MGSELESLVEQESRAAWAKINGEEEEADAVLPSSDPATSSPMIELADDEPIEEPIEDGEPLTE